ncbi:MAG: efflux RND transporter periplasmic adaptor subunit [Acidobacteriota bacterium]|nr:efflux RND transporter periplasmic adaptor subunit [Acidobacteriota bacterium]
MKTRWLLLFLLAVAAGAGAWLARHRYQQLHSQRPAIVSEIPVTTARVRQELFIAERTAYGVVATDQRAILRARTAGQITVIAAREGTPVRAGQTLAELDGTPGLPTGDRAARTTALSQLEHSIAALEQAVANLERIYRRDRMLLENRAIAAQVAELSENRWQEARAQLATRKSEVAGLVAQLEQFTIKAPFTGTVSRVHGSVGDVVAPGAPLLELESTTPCKIVVTVAADDLAFLAVGSRARILHGGSTIEAKISRIHPAARGGAGTVEVSLPTPPFDLPTGSAVTVLLETACLADALVVPLDAVVEGPTTARLHVLDHGVVRLVPVRVLAATEHRAAVAGDIRAGDVVVRGSESLLLRLTDGAKVSVHNPPVAGKVKTHG